jgi:hypothetical protein
MVMALGPPPADEMPQHDAPESWQLQHRESPVYFLTKCARTSEPVVVGHDDGQQQEKAGYMKPQHDRGHAAKRMQLTPPDLRSSRALLRGRYLHGLASQGVCIHAGAVFDRPARLSAAQSAPDAQRQQSDERGAATQVVAVLAVEGAGVAASVRSRRVDLLALGAAATLACPAHGAPVGLEAVPVPEDATGDHASPLPVSPRTVTRDWYLKKIVNHCG